MTGCASVGAIIVECECREGSCSCSCSAIAGKDELSGAGEEREGDWEVCEVDECECERGLEAGTEADERVLLLVLPLRRGRDVGSCC